MSGNTSQGPSVPASSDHDNIMHNPVALPDPLRYLYVAYLLLIIFIGVPGNILIAVVYGRTKTKNTCDWFILFMSVTDCTVCILSPVLHLRYELMIDIPWMTGPLCGIEHWLQLTAMLSSCHYLTAIAIDRYVKICNSRLPTVKPKSAPYACVVSFVSSAVICIYPSIDSFQIDICGLFDPRGFETSQKVYFTIIFAGFVVCFILVTFAYWNVCKQIFIKMKTKQRLLEQNGLHETTKNDEVQESVSQQPGKFSYSCSSLRLLSTKCFQTACCCRKEVCSNGKDVMPSEFNKERLDIEQVPLTSTNHSKQNDLSLKSHSDNLLQDEAERPKGESNVDISLDICKNRYDFQLEKESIKVQPLSTEYLKPDKQTLHGMEGTKMTLLSLTTASWPSTEEEPTPSADIPVSFYLENLISQAQGIQLRDTGHPGEIPGLKNEDFSSKTGLGLSSNKPLELCGASESMVSNIYENKLSLLDEADERRAALEGNASRALVKCSVSAGSDGPVETTLLTSSRSQPLLGPHKSKSGPNDRTPGSGYCDQGVLFPNKSTVQQGSMHGSGFVGDEQTNTLQLVRSLSADNLWNAQSLFLKQLRIHRAKDDIERKTLQHPLLLNESQNCCSGKNDPLKGDKTNQNVAVEEDKSEPHQVLNLVNKIATPSAPVNTCNAKKAYAAPPIDVKNSLRSQHSHPVNEDANVPSGTTVRHISTPSRSFEDSHGKNFRSSHGDNLTVPLRSQRPHLKNMNSCSIDSESGGDEIEEDMPTGSFMKRWRSQVRRKARGRERKGLTSSGKSMCSTTGKRFARERQITFMLISVTLTFLLSSAPSWAVWVAVLWEPRAMSVGLTSRIIVVATVGVYLLNFISSYFIFYAFNPSFRRKCRDLLRCSSQHKASSVRGNDAADV
ncbi:orexin receptor type 2 [Elysia marginata]|uniref:Orexin receptor type 2 n=1 Tax=Elysia marginata TaxID=1093978 RepID=A0AAV4H0F2_9GAST|nr:orexin receptor type 2 [Elysia marginata]